MKKIFMFFTIGLLVFGTGGCRKSGEKEAPAGKTKLRASAQVKRAEKPKSEEQIPSSQVPVQEPENPEAFQEKMNEMKAAADQVINELVQKAKQGGDPEELFREGVDRINKIMRPEFGPANAWLFNERDNRLERLCNELGLKPSTCGRIAEEESPESE